MYKLVERWKATGELSRLGVLHSPPTTHWTVRKRRHSGHFGGEDGDQEDEDEAEDDAGGSPGSRMSGLTGAGTQGTQDTHIFVEPRGSKECTNMLKTYLRNIERRRSSLLMCVCRGKISEGLDFADDKVGRSMLILACR